MLDSLLKSAFIKLPRPVRFFAHQLVASSLDHDGVGVVEVVLQHPAEWPMVFGHRLDEARAALIRYGDRGYIRTSVRYDLDVHGEDATADVSFTVAEGRLAFATGEAVHVDGGMHIAR